MDDHPLRSLPVEVVVSVGRARPLVRDLLALGENAVLPLDRRVDDPVELWIGDRLIARGELMEAEGEPGQLAVRLTEVPRVPEAARASGPPNASRAPDAVLLDLRMPGLDGMEVLRRIRARPDAPPVAVITAVPTGENTIEAMRLGAADHLAKPVGRDGLRALLIQASNAR